MACEEKIYLKPVAWVESTMQYMHGKHWTSELPGKVGVWMSWHSPHHLRVFTTQAFPLFSMTKLSCVNCVPLVFPKSFRVFSWVICCIWCPKDQELIIVLKCGLISNPDENGRRHNQNGTRHNQNGTRQKVRTFTKQTTFRTGNIVYPVNTLNCQNILWSRVKLSTCSLS